MKTQEIEQLLSATTETPRLEFKGAMSWSHKTLVRDILAMANLRDGGRIIFGVEDETMQRLGLTPEQVQSFSYERMKDQIAPFADPHVNFNVEVAIDEGGKSFVVVTVAEFEEIPVICIRDGEHVNAGEIYYRTERARPQSARVANANELRDILERSTVRIGQRFKSLGLIPARGGEAARRYQQDLDAELEGL